MKMQTFHVIKYDLKGHIRLLLCLKINFSLDIYTIYFKSNFTNTFVLVFVKISIYISFILMYLTHIGKYLGSYKSRINQYRITIELFNYIIPLARP